MVLKSSDFLVEFLREANDEKFAMKALSASMDEGPKKIFDIATLGGEIDC
jgi:hypothetical protein